MIRQATYPALFGVLCIACSTGRDTDIAGGIATRDSAGIAIVENGTSPASTWRLSPEPVVEVGGSGPVEQTPLDPTAVFTDAAGRIIVGDGNQSGWHAVLVYDADGAFLMKLGGRGRGPGEFGGQLWWAGPFRGDSIVAWDRRGPFIKVYGGDGGFSRDVLIPEFARRPPANTFGFTPGFHGAFDDGTLLTSSDGVLDIAGPVGPKNYMHLLLAVDPAGAVHDTIGEFALWQAWWDGQQQQSYLFGAATQIAPYGNEWILGPSEHYEYRIMHRDGTPRMIVRKPFTARAVTDADVQAMITVFMDSPRVRSRSDEQRADYRREMEATPRADMMPAYSKILTDAGRNVWVERFRWFDPWSLPPDPQPTTWDVFTPEGEWIAEILVPSRVVLLSIAQGRVLGVRLDESDVRHVVVYELLRS